MTQHELRLQRVRQHLAGIGTAVSACSSYAEREDIANLICRFLGRGDSGIAIAVIALAPKSEG